jgi:hypothetical protein
MAELAAPALEERLFTLLVDDYCCGATWKQPTKAAPVPVSRRPMQGIACVRAAA